jgi:hypothetical protein
MKLYATGAAAKAAGITRATLQMWIRTDRIAAPPIQLVDNRAVRVWSEADIGRIKAFRGTLKPGRVPKKKSTVAGAGGLTQ